jgi:hypothetical protein
MINLSPVLQILDLDEKNRYFIDNLYKSINKYPECNWNDALSNGQISSKLWLIEELKKLDLDLGVVFVCAGWLGTLPALVFKDGNLRYKCFRSFDIDPQCADAADSLNKDPYVIDNWQFKATTFNIFDINYYNHPFQCWSKTNNRMSYPVDTIPDTIINTSCDHINPFESWWNLIPENKLVILQNNDSKIDDDHVNNITNLEDMKKQAPMKTLLFEGILKLSDYNRYMLIGRK